MKSPLFSTALALSIALLSASANAETFPKVTSVDGIRSIMCHNDGQGNEEPGSTVDMNMKSVIYFRNDTAAKKAQFLVDDYSLNLNSDTNLHSTFGELYYLTLNGDKIDFAFIADWKSSGSLNITYGDYGQIFAKGQIVDKGWTRDLNCNIRLK